MQCDLSTLLQFFATSKDVSIGPVAVMSLTVSQIITHVQNAHGDRWEGPEIATTISFICGFIVLGIGLLRLGWIIEFIPLPAVSGFMTGSGKLLTSLLFLKCSLYYKPSTSRRVKFQA